jgi:hypothetical protein
VTERLQTAFDWLVVLPERLRHKWRVPVAVGNSVDVLGEIGVEQQHGQTDVEDALRRAGVSAAGARERRARDRDRSGASALPAPKGNRIRYVPLARRAAAAL